jgi:hypothetical protein
MIAEKISVCGKYEVRFSASDHKYFAKELNTGLQIGQNNIISVTTFISSLFPKFESNDVVKTLTPKTRIKYVGMTDEQIIKYWNDNAVHTADLGTRMHSVMEELLKNPTNIVIPEPVVSKFDDIVPECLHDRDGIIIRRNHIEQFLKHMFDNNLVPISQEKLVFSPDVLIAGTFDALFKNTITEQFYLYDWKRRKEFTYENRYEHGKEHTPVSKLSHTHYTSALIQLNLYRRLLLDAEGINVSVMRIITIHPSNESILINDIPIDDSLIDSLFEFRKSSIT